MSQRLRILHLTAGSDAGGVSRYIFDLCSAMYASGHDVYVAGERGAWHGMFEKAPFPWLEVPLKGSPFALNRAAETLRDFLRDRGIDVLHTHYRRATLAARKLQSMHGVPPVLYTVHLSDISLAWPLRRFSDFGDHTHVASAQARRWTIETAQVEPDRVSIIPHGIHVERFPQRTDAEFLAARKALGPRPGDLVAAYVGRLDDPKNVDWLLDIAASSRRALPDLRIVITGDGPHERSLRKRVARDELEHRVLLIGERDPLPIYQMADALLLPSEREGFSYACAEAMSVGVPVLRTRTAGTEELIVENETGRSTAIDHDAFVSTAIDFLGDHEALHHMGANAARHIREHFTFEQQLARTIELYRCVMNASRGR
jgi:glycosyltransferase involved in cell wall biosynthesis